MRSFFFILAALFATVTHAGVVNYALTLQIESANQPNCSAPNPSHQYFGCLAIGDTFTGALSFDSELLESDGAKTVKLISFYQNFGGWQFNMGNGFRDQNGFAVGPTLLVESGELIDLKGGVFGAGDYSYIDWFWAGENTFLAHDETGSTYQGTVTIARVPEPASLLLVGSALALLISNRRKGYGREVHGSGSY